MFVPNCLRRALVCSLLLLGSAVVAVHADEPASAPTETSTNKPLSVQVKAQLYAVDLDLDGHQQTGFGLEFADAEAALRSQLDLPADQGVVIVGVVPGSAAATAGLQQNDVLLTLNDAVMGSAELLRNSLVALNESAQEPAKKLPASVTYLRGGKKITATLSSQPMGADQLIGRLMIGVDQQKYWIGVGVSDVDATLRAQLKLPENQGLIVTEVKPDSAAEKAGLKEHDLLLEYNDTALATPEDLRRIVNELGKDSKTGNMKLLRGGKPATLPVTPTEKQIELAIVKANEAALATQLLLANQEQLEIIHSLENQYNKQIAARALIFATKSATDPWTAINAEKAKVEQAAVSADHHFKQLLEAVQQLSKKVDSLEQAIKKNEGGSK